MSKVDISQILRQSDLMFSSAERVNNENMWSDLSEFMLNNQFTGMQLTASQTDIGNLTNSAKGTKKTRRVFDSTALQAVQDLASSFQGTITNPATQWSNLRFKDDELNDDEDSVRWLQKVNDTIHESFNESNLNTELGKGYQSLVAMANMALFIEQDLTDAGTFNKLRFTSLHLSHVAWSDNKDSIVDTVYRKVVMTAKQATEKWPDKVSDAILRALENEPEKEFEILHCIRPRDKEDIKLNELGLSLPEDRPVMSMYIEVNTKTVVEEGGYYEFPVVVSRWGTSSNEIYGRGPGHLALPDVRSLNVLKEEHLTAVAKDNNPPMLMTQRDQIGQLNLNPRTVSIVRDVNGVREMVSGARTDRIQWCVTQLVGSIKGLFFLDKIMLPPRNETGEMTAFEVSQRVEQMQRVLGPVLSRLNSEFLQPLIVRVFRMLLRADELPEAPELVKEKGIDVDIIFVNQLARAQQIQDVSSINQWIQNLSLIAQADPSILDNIDTDGVARHTAKILGVPEEAVRASDEVVAIRQQRQQAQQQQQALEGANLAADAVSKIGGPDALS